VCLLFELGSSFTLDTSLRVLGCNLVFCLTQKEGERSGDGRRSEDDKYSYKQVKKNASKYGHHFEDGSPFENMEVMHLVRNDEVAKRPL